MVCFVHGFDCDDTFGEIYNPIVLKGHFVLCVLFCKGKAIEVVESLIQLSLGLSHSSCMIEYLRRLLLCDCVGKRHCMNTSVC